MNWKEVGKYIQAVAPRIAGLLTNAVDKGLNLVVDLLYSEFGVDKKTDVVLAALKANPDQLIKIRELEIIHKTKLKELKIEESIKRLERGKI